MRPRSGLMLTGTGSSLHPATDGWQPHCFGGCIIVTAYGSDKHLKKKEKKMAANEDCFGFVSLQRLKPELSPALCN